VFINGLLIKNDTNLRPSRMSLRQQARKITVIDLRETDRDQQIIDSTGILSQKHLFSEYFSE